jgi:hypothetical protein
VAVQNGDNFLLAIVAIPRQAFNTLEMLERVLRDHGVEFPKYALDPQTQGDARTKKHADVCNGYLPTELADEEERKMGCAECCDCWCHFTFTNPDGTDREDADGLRAEIRC